MSGPLGEAATIERIPRTPYAQALGSPCGTGASGEPTGHPPAADPVRELIARHRTLCAAATHPLEIAAGLEVRGYTDRAAAQFRHRDLFSLAEELYARVPRSQDRPRWQPPHDESVRRSGPGLASLLPGALCAAGTAVAHARPDRAPAVTAVTLAVAWLTLVVWVVRTRRAPSPSGSWRAQPLARATLRLVGLALPAFWLPAFWLFGPWALGALLPTAQRVARPAGPATLAMASALALAVPPAVWCGSWFARRCRALLAEARDPGEFAAGARWSLAWATLVFLTVLVTMLLVARPIAGARSAAVTGAADGALLPTVAVQATGPWAVVSAVSLGSLLFLAWLLALHGRASAAAAGVAGACLVQAGALVLAALHGVPAVAAALDSPGVTGLLTARPEAVSWLPCGTAALLLLVRARAVLGRASGHLPCL